MNGLNTATQTFSIGTAGSDFNIVSAGSTHTFNIPDASSIARGLVSTGTQTFTGPKTFSSPTTFNGQITHNHATVFASLAIPNLPTGGSIGTAATTVDIKTTFDINQTTADQTLTIPTPTSTTP